MPVFSYKASSAVASDTAGTIAADTPRQARDLLRDRGLIIRDLSDVHASERPRRIFFRSTSKHHVTLFLREVSTLLSVGLPLLECLETLAQQHKGPFHTNLVTLRDRMAGGLSLSAAMREQPRLFDDLCVSIAEVGEDAGTLDTSLETLAEFRSRSEQLAGRIITTLIHPIIVLTVAAAATMFLMTFVVPRILEPLIEQGQPLPLPTRIVKGASDFVVTWWPLLIGAVAAVACAIAIILRSPSGRFAWHRILLRIPLIGDLIVKQSIMRLAVVLSTLLKSGIPFVRAMQITLQTTSNLVLRDALSQCEKAVVAGEDIAAALRQTGAFPPMVVQVFAVGQQSGKLEQMLDKLATAYDQEVSRSTQRLTAVVEPLLIVLLAMVVLMIVLATVLPILEAGNAIQ
jgi:general secretion pathway protein F